MAASDVRHAAPVIPVEPPTTSTQPALYLLSRAVRRGTSSRTAWLTRPFSVSRLSRPMSATSTLAGVKAPGADRVTHLRRVERHRRGRADGDACHLPGRGVDARRHVDGDGLIAEGVDQLDRVGRLPSRRSRETGAEQGVDDDVGRTRFGDERETQLPGTPQVLGGVAADAGLVGEQPDLHVSCRPRGEAARRRGRHPRSLPARTRRRCETHRGSAAARCRRRPARPAPSAPASGPRRPLPPRASPSPCRGARSRSIASRHPLSPGGAASGSSSSSTAQIAQARPFECVIDRSIRPARTRPAKAFVLPERRTSGFGRPAISISRQVKRTPQPSALPTASLPANRAA